jgi:hypothetical protein
VSNDNIKLDEDNKAEKLSSAAIARRHALLKGLSRGSVVLAVAAPIQTLASQTLLTADRNHVCSISGMQSTMHSAAPDSQVCGGYSPGWWKQVQTKKGSSPVPRRTWPTLPNQWTYNTPCKTVFTYCGFPNSVTLLQALLSYPSSDEYHWICAWLNALSGSYNFPYSGAQVLGFYYAGKGTPKYNNALAFFKTYMETHTF